ncbi:MAG TPA: DoxX family protein [Steroidobacteraceae bacterium]|nr:DoxX family protein [Steroidobacteraceae bacterium]
MKLRGLIDSLTRFDRYLDALQAPFALLVRVYVSWVFLKSALLKLQDWEQTVSLFELEYRVPLLSPLAGAVAGTAGELIFPVLLILGLGGRIAPIGLFAVNAMAVISYAHVFFEDTGIAGLRQHQLWGFMLLMLIFYGTGAWSLDRLLQQSGRRAST